MTLEEAKNKIFYMAESEKENYQSCGSEYFVGLYQGMHDALEVLKEVKPVQAS